MKILYLTSRIPYPIDKGDKLRAYHQIKHLSENHEISLFSLNEESNNQLNYSELEKYCSKIFVEKLGKFEIIKNIFFHLFSKLPFQVSYFYSKRIQKKINKIIDIEKPDLIFCQLIRMAEYVINQKKYSRLIDYVDILSKGLERRAEIANLFLKPVLIWEYNKVKNYEKNCFEKFNEHIIITKQDRDLLAFKEKEKVHIIPNGIDTDYFKPLNNTKKYDILFTGNLSYPPNIEAALYLVKKILPKLLEVQPEIKILIAGASPSKKVLSLSSTNVAIKSWADDIRDYYSVTKIYVAPLQIGTGLQNKLLEAMAMGLPCITSPLSQQGINAPVGEVLLTADSPEKYFKLIYKLLYEQEFSQSLSINAIKFVSENFDWVKIVETLENNILNAE